jgi:hypothetical protein
LSFTTATITGLRDVFFQGALGPAEGLAPRNAPPGAES